MYEGDTPQFKHDCDRCTFIGCDVVVNGTKRELVDLYYCGDLNTVDAFGTTFIIRYSSEPSEYSSMEIGSLLKSNGTGPLATIAKRIFQVKSVELIKA